MPLELYRRHSASCKFADKGQNYTKCKCMIWCYGHLKGMPVRESMPRGRGRWRHNYGCRTAISARVRNVRELTGLRLEDFRSFRASRGCTPHTQRKKIEHLRAFCAFCVDHDWISKNWAKKSKPPVGGNSVTLSYEPHEVSALLDACDKITNFNETFQERAGLRARAPILLLLYSGLRISDAITLERRRVDAQGRILM